MHTKKPLPKGDWMNQTELLEALTHKFNSTDLAYKIWNSCSPEIASTGTPYYNTKALKSMIDPNLFRQIECEVSTLMILK